VARESNTNRVSIPGAFERAELGLAQVRAGEGKPLGEL
jgi:hypothetical protein